MAKLILSAFSDEYSESLLEQVKGLNSFNIEYMEMRGVNGKNVSTLTKDEVKEAKRILDDHGIKLSSVGSPLGKIKIDGDVKAHLETAKWVYEIANEFGTKNVRMFSFYLPEGKTREDCKSEVYDALEKMLILADKAGVNLCHENEALIYGESPENCLELLNHFNGKLKCVFDMANFILEGHDVMKGYELLKDKIEYFHIKDALKIGAIVPAGKGEGRIKEILDDYKANYDKDTFITLEPHLETFLGLSNIAAKSFENPYKYANCKEAFADAVQKLKELL